MESMMHQIMSYATMATFSLVMDAKKIELSRLDSNAPTMRQSQVSAIQTVAMVSKIQHLQSSSVTTETIWISMVALVRDKLRQTMFELLA